MISEQKTSWNTSNDGFTSGNKEEVEFWEDILIPPEELLVAEA